MCVCGFLIGKYSLVQERKQNLYSIVCDSYPYHKLPKTYTYTVVLESWLIWTDHTRPVQFHGRKVYCGGGRQRRGDEDQKESVFYLGCEIPIRREKWEVDQVDVDAENVWRLPWQKMRGSLSATSDIIVITGFGGDLQP